jgi:hypothetical protein
MPQRWTTCFAAVVLVASLACGAAPGAEDEPVSSNSTGNLDVEEEQVPLSFEELLEQAEQGDVEAQWNLGLMYANGEGVPEDDEEAVRLFRLAADQGNANGQYRLGLMYVNGEGVPEDDEEAVRWWRLAADQGHVYGQFGLGVRYENGEGVPQDDAKAIHWYRLAAEQGYANGQYRLGLMYRSGLGVPQDDVEAYKWFNLAASRSTGITRISAVEARDQVANRLTPEQRAEAQRLAREWDEAHRR